MGSRYLVICQKCHGRTWVHDGGGFTFHVLHCDACGRPNKVSFKDLGEIHLRYVKGLGGPYSVSSSESDRWIQEKYPGDSVTESEYHEAVEATLTRCKCGGSFKFNAPIRCKHCRSTKLEIDPDEPQVLCD